MHYSTHLSRKLLCHTHFRNLVTSPAFASLPPSLSVAPSAPETASSSFLRLHFLCFSETPQSLMSLRGGAAIRGRHKWKYFQITSSRVSAANEQKSLQTDNRQSGKKICFKGEISFLLLLGFASFFSYISYSLQWHLLVAAVTMVLELIG